MHRLEQQSAGANVCLHKHGVLPPSVQRLWSDKRLVDIAQQLLGGPQVDVAGHPVWNLRVKVPGAEAAVVPWHQGERHPRTHTRVTQQERSSGCQICCETCFVAHGDPVEYEDGPWGSSCLKP